MLKGKHQIYRTVKVARDRTFSVSEHKLYTLRNLATEQKNEAQKSIV